MDVLVTVAVIFHLDMVNSNLIVRESLTPQWAEWGGQEASFNNSLIIQFVGK